MRSPYRVHGRCTVLAAQDRDPHKGRRDERNQAGPVTPQNRVDQNLEQPDPSRQQQRARWRGGQSEAQPPAVRTQQRQ
jgi:hypothetical protein